jgi:hypothetical protein
MSHPVSVDALLELGEVLAVVNDGDDFDDLELLWSRNQISYGKTRRCALRASRTTVRN